ncbi:MAG TPA: PAS-domain containing protein [Acetobacteraceae bacterium]|nr:PAS-domain containing protein [Acetobacteraceae bacterium]
MLNDFSLQIFIADEQGTVRASTRAAIVGTMISQRDYFRHEASLPADDGKMYIGSLTQGQVTRQWQLNLARRLDHGDGTFAGIIAASYDPNALSRFHLDETATGRGVIGLVSMKDGKAWTLTDRAPSVADIAGTQLFSVLREENEGSWRGRSGLDRADRLYAFATIPDRDLKVVVGIDLAAAMRGSTAWEYNAVLFAVGTSIVLVLLAILLLRTFDATRRRHQALAHEREILEAALTGMSDGIMMVDRDLRLMAWNQHFPEFTGVPNDILHVGLQMEDILRSQVTAGEFGPVEIEAEVSRRMTLIRSGASMGAMERPRPTGRHIEIRRNPLPGGGFVTLYSDVTARRHAEERLRQAQTMAALGRLTAGVAHDFNNLLVSITGNADLLQEPLAESPELAQRLATILQSADRGAELVKRLLAFGRKQALAPTLIDLNQLVGGIRNLLASTLGRGIIVVTELAEGLWPVMADQVQVEHVVLNLAINARDAMPEGGTLTITTANTSLEQVGMASPDLPTGDYVTVSVADTGTGMGREVLQNAFEPFFTTKPPGQGSGLGLSQVYGVAHQSGGGVRIDSAVGIGTTVTVFFPRAETIAEPGLERAATAMVPDQTPRASRTILVVDDEPECRATIADILTTYGFTVTVAAGGEEALSLLDRDMRFDLLLADYTMPGMTGVELAHVVRARGERMPIVFLTGGGSAGEWVSGERWVLTKPFLTRSLLDMVRAALDHAHRGNGARDPASQDA